MNQFGLESLVLQRPSTYFDELAKKMKSALFTLNFTALLNFYPLKTDDNKLVPLKVMFSSLIEIFHKKSIN